MHGHRNAEDHIMTKTSIELKAASDAWARANLIAGKAEQRMIDAIAARNTTGDRAKAANAIAEYRVLHAAYLAAHAEFFSALRGARG